MHKHDSQIQMNKKKMKRTTRNFALKLAPPHKVSVHLVLHSAEFHVVLLKFEKIWNNCL